ncbi:MAG: hypothetical protein QOD83_3459 [Solirubrobacteraceae bacterium]|jgi:choline dehydrogenase-like flavoprotein|nr:hypothetical protein [Solirubrobacteraceae bacterium]
MRRKASTLPAEAEIEADVAIVGAGPMGIVLALELARAGRRVTLIESGDDRFNASAQGLSDSDSQGEDYFHVAKDLAVRRQVGGTSVLWGGRCVPFDPVDFEPRPAVPDQLWPVTYEEFSSYLQRACDWCVCGAATFNAHELRGLAERELVPGLSDGDVRTSDLERWSLPTRFGRTYGAALDASPSLDLITGLTCTDIVCTPDGTSVQRLELRTVDGASATVRARRYVLATGGLEATRLLLASNAVHREGIGNHSGHLGRWYMAHVEARIARIHLSTPPQQTIFDHERDQDGVYVRRRFTFAREFQHRESMSNAATWIVNPELGDASHGSGILSGVYLTLISPIGRFLLAEAIRQVGTKTSRPTTIAAHLLNVIRDIVPATRFAVSFTYRRFLRRGRKAPGFFVASPTNVYQLHYHGEHLPHHESRVELGEECDALGVPRLRTKMYFSDRDVQSVRRAMEHIDTHLRAHGVGHLEYLYDDVESAVYTHLGANAGYHQTGTTRMSASPDDGVVTPDLAIHGMEDLFVASTSVFPTSSQANPTLTGVAFAVRLADTLNAQLDHPRRGAASAPLRGAHAR